MDQRWSMMKRLFQVLKASVLLILTSFGCTLLTRRYFLSFHGGNPLSWLQTAVLLFSPLLLSSYTLRRQSPLFLPKRSLLAATAGFGALIGLANYLYPASLPVSTSSLRLSSDLSNTALLAYLHKKNKSDTISVSLQFTTVVVAAWAFGLWQGRPVCWHLAATAFGMFVVPLIEKRLGGVDLEFELVMAKGLVWTACLAAKDMDPTEAVARACGIGEAAYLAVAVSSAVLFQGVFWGPGGVVYYSSALLAASGVVAMLPLLLPAATDDDTFLLLQLIRVEKAVSLFLALWGFVSYFKGETMSQQEEQQQSSRSG